MSLQRWLKENYGIRLVVMDGLEVYGYYIHDEKIMFISSEIPDEKIVTIVLHELGHHLKDEDVIGDYKNYIARSKMEYLANSYMIENLLDEWCDTNNIDLNDVNCVTFLEVNDLPLKYIPIVEKVMRTKLSSKR